MALPVLNDTSPEDVCPSALATVIEPDAPATEVPLENCTAPPASPGAKVLPADIIISPPDCTSLVPTLMDMEPEAAPKALPVSSTIEPLAPPLLAPVITVTEPDAAVVGENASPLSGSVNVNSPAEALLT